MIQFLVYVDHHHLSETRNVYFFIHLTYSWHELIFPLYRLIDNEIVLSLTT